MPLVCAPGALAPGGTLSASTYGTALAAAYSTVHHARSEGTHAMRQRVASAFLEFLTRLPAELNKNISNATANDVLVFLQLEWRHHGRTHLPDGTIVASASGLGNAASALGATFDILGRRGEWDPLTLSGNPCASFEVRLYRSGYQRELWGQDIEPTAATPLRHDKVLALVVHLDAKRALLTADPIYSESRFLQLRGLLLERDALLFTYLSASIQRGGEGARLRLCDIRTAHSEGVTGVSLPLGNALIADRAPAVSVHPNGVKTRQRRDCGHFLLQPHPDSRVCFMSRLAHFSSSCRALGFPLRAPAGFIFRIMDPQDRRRLIETPLSVSASLSRLRASLKSLGDYQGETMHSFRRAGMQSDQDTGVTPHETMKRALIVSPSSYNLYTDRRRPTKAQRMCE